MYTKANIPLSCLQQKAPVLESPLVSPEILGGCQQSTSPMGQRVPDNNTNTKMNVKFKSKLEG